MLVASFAAQRTTEPVPQWILPPRSCEFLARLAELLPTGSTAFEFGSGRSTHVLRRAFAAVTSVEDSADWLNATEELENAAAKRTSDHTAVISLRRRWNRLRLIESFDVGSRADVLRRLQESNLVLVDSPPNPAKREHALYTALRHTPAGAVVVADDLDVASTARFSQRLARQNRTAFRFWLLDIDHRLGVFLKLQRTRRIRSVPTLREFVGTWLRA